MNRNPSPRGESERGGPSSLPVNWVIDREDRREGGWGGGRQVSNWLPRLDTGAKQVSGRPERKKEKKRKEKGKERKKGNVATERGCVSYAISED